MYVTTEWSVTTSGTDQPVLIVRHVYVQQVGGGRSRWKSVGLTVNTTNSTLYEQFVEGLRPRTGYAVRVSVLYRSTLRSVWPSSIQHTFFTSRTMFCFCFCAFVCLSVCLSVTTITRKVVGEFSWNFLVRWDVTSNSRLILVVIRTTTGLLFWRTLHIHCGLCRDCSLNELNKLNYLFASCGFVPLGGHQEWCQVDSRL